MKINSFYEPETGSWTYLLADSLSGEAAIIDPVAVYDPVSGLLDHTLVDTVLETARQHAWRITWALETHAHADHLTAAAYVQQKTSARLAIGRGICGVQQTVCRMFHLETVATDGSQFDRLLADGDSIRLGDLNIRILETPGHTKDSISYLAGDAAFVGDTLFAPCHGTARCDFPGGDAGQLFDSIQRIHTLPDETRLFLCHDYPEPGQAPRCLVPMAESRASNIHVRTGSSRDEFIALRVHRDAQLGLPRLIMPALQLNIRAGNAPCSESNGVSYLKSPFDCRLAVLTAKTDC